MRNISLLSAMVLTAFATCGQEVPDTIANIKNVHSLSVVRTPEGISLTADGKGSDSDFHYEYTSAYTADSTRLGNSIFNLPFLMHHAPANKNGGSQGITSSWDFEAYVGTSVPTGGTPAGASFEIGASRVLAGSLHLSRVVSIGTGLGLGYLQYSVGDGMCFAADGQHLLFAAQPEGSYDCKSRLKIFRLHVPVSMNFKLPHNFEITAGAWLNFNCDVRATTAYTKDNVRTSQSFKRLHQRVLNTDAFLSVGLREVSLYARYSPQSIFRSGWGPEFDSFSIGLITKF